MAEVRLSTVRRDVIKSTKCSAGVTDSQLLDRFVKQRDEAAFELLVWRHQRMVMSLCRRILRGEQDTEDASQATFLALACKAGSIGKREAIASWLYKVAYRVASRERMNQEKRCRHAQQAATGRLDEHSPSAGAEVMEADIRAAIHEEINRLPKSYRAAVVLCYLEGKTNEEAALQMNCPVGTVVTWLARARRKLRSRLDRRGVAISVGCIETVLAARDSLAAPSLTFVEQTVQAALLFAADQPAPGLVSAKVAELTRGVLETMTMTKLKFAIAVLAIGLATAGSSVFALSHLPQDKPILRPVHALQSGSIHADQPRVDKPDDPEQTKPVAEQAKNQAPKKDDDKIHTAKDVVSQSFKVGKSPKVIVDINNGAIEIDATSAADVEARITKEGRGKTDELAKEALKSLEVKMTQDGDTVQIQEVKKQGQLSRDYSASASATLKVPAGTTLHLNTVNGSVTINSGSGKIHVQTVNGEVRASQAKGALELRSTNGKIVVKEATGSIDLKTLNGEIEIHGENSVVTAETTNGAVRFEGSLAKGDHTFRTTNGEIAITLPAGSSFRLEADTTHGKIKNEFSPDGAPEKNKTQLRSTIGQNPVVIIRLHTTNGSISVRRQEAKK